MRGGHHNYPYASTQEAARRRKPGSEPLLGEDAEQEDAAEDAEEEEDVTKDKMIKVRTDRSSGEGEEVDVIRLSVCLDREILRGSQVFDHMHLMVLLRPDQEVIPTLLEVKGLWEIKTAAGYLAIARLKISKFETA